MEKKEKIYKCEYCEESFKRSQALGSHISNIHKNLPSTKPIPTPTFLEQDPEIQNLKKQIEKRRLERELEGIEATPQAIQLAERTKMLEMKIQNLEKETTYLKKFEPTINNLITKQYYIIEYFILLIRHSSITNKGKKMLFEMMLKQFPKEIKQLAEALANSNS